MAVATKVRIYELAKELGVTNKDVMDRLEKMGVPAKSHSSSIEQDVADKITAEFKKPKKSSEAPAKTAKTPQKPTGAKKETAKEAPKKETPVAKAPAKTQAAPAKPAAAPAAKPAAPAPQAVKPAVPAPQPARPASTTQVAQPLPKKPATPPPAQAKPAAAAVAQTKTNPSNVAVKEPVKTQDEILEDEALLEALTAPTEDEPYSEIAQSVEKHQKTGEGVKTFRKTTDTDKGEKVLTPQQRKELQEQQEEVVEIPPVITIDGPTTLSELAAKTNKRETELIRHLFMKGIMVTVNQTMQVDDAIKLAEELGFMAEGPSKNAISETAPELKVKHAKGHHLKPRAPVVSIMGHVDHGKTSLLDAIREARHKIVDSEAGGITQSIGAYTVEKDNHKIVFIDTPGHEAFTAMRMRGARATDIAILVVAADDGVMPQTIEAINHAKAANIPIIVAVNKIDKEGADPDRVMGQLAEHGLTPEQWGGDTICVPVSAMKKTGLDSLLEMIILVSDLQELKSDSTIPAEGVVIEARIDKGMGPVATVLVQHGTLHVGENILINKTGGRVRALISDSGERIRSAGPSTPVEILGLNEVPQAGETVIVVRNDKEFKRLLQQAQQADRDQRLTNKMVAHHGLMSDSETNRKDFYVIIKGDTNGSVEALSQSIIQMATEEVSVHMLHAGTGDVSEADVLLASASQALIIAFNVKEDPTAQKAAIDKGVEIRSYDVIYHVTEEVEKIMLGLLTPETEEQETGQAEVRQLFKFGKTQIAGCYVTEGKIVRNGTSRVFRNGKEIFKGTLNNLKRFKDDAKEVAQGYECGISFDKFNDIQPGDIIKMYTLKEIERTSL